MKALILAAGIGSRLGELTTDLPKCLLPVCRKPILEYQLDALLKNGITNIVVVLGHQKEKIKKFLTTHRKYDSIKFTFTENPEYATSNSSYSYWSAREEVIKEPYIHLNCDIVLFPDLICRLKESPYDNVILVDKTVKLDDSMEQVVLDGERIIRMDKASLPQACGRGSGVAKISPSAVTQMLVKLEEHLAKGDKSQHCYGLMRYALTKVPFYTLDAEGLLFREINTVQELAEAEKAVGRYLQFSSS